MTLHAATFRVSNTLLIQALGMPADTQIVGTGPVMWGDDTEFYVLHPDLPELPEGGKPIEITPIITVHPDGSKAWDWNVPHGH